MFSRTFRIVFTLLVMLSIQARSEDIVDKSWIFTSSTLNWYGYGVSSFGFANSAWWGVSNGTDPYLYNSTTFNISARFSHYISIKMRMYKNPSITDRFGASDGDISWELASPPGFNSEQKIPFKTYGNGAWKIYNIRVGNHAKWTGTIRRLRVDPCSISGAKFEIAWIKIVQDMTGPAYNAENMWTYEDGQSTNDNTPTISLRDFYDDVSGIDRADFYCRPGFSTSESDWVLKGIDADGTDSYQFTYPALADGTYDLGVRLYDKAGNATSWLDGDDKWIDDLNINTNLPATINVDAGVVGDTVPKEIFGNNIMWNQWSGKYDAATGNLTSNLEASISKMGLPVLRYPGGCYSDTFYWKKSIGPVASRPNQYPNGCNTTISNAGPAKFGLDEFLRFCERRGIKPMFTCRFRWPGSPQAAGTVGGQTVVLDSADPFNEALNDAIDLVEYCNSPNDGSNPNGGTDWAATRAANGHPAPYNVKFFEIGNEPWGPDPWGSPANLGLDGPSEYAVAFIKYLQGMKAVDPTIKVSATTHLQGQLDFDLNKPEWTNSLYEQVGSEIDYAQAHPYLPYSAWQTDPVKLYDETMATPKALDDLLSTQRTTIMRTAPEKVGVIKLRLTEWNINYNWWYDPAQGRINTYHTKTLKAAVALADTFRVFIENRDLVESAEWWHMVGGGPWGCIDGNDTTPYPAFHSFRIFNCHFGDKLVQSKVTGSPTFDYVQSGGVLKTQYGLAYLTAIASRSEDGKSLYLVVINKDRTNAHSSNVNLANFIQAPFSQVKAEIWELNGPNVDDYNNVNNVKITEGSSNFSPSFTYSFPAHSVTSFKFTPAATVVDKLGALKDLQNNMVVQVNDKAVSAVFPPSVLYIEEEDRSSGIRVENNTISVTPGKRVSVSGALSKNADGERCIVADNVTLESGTGSVKPVLISNTALGGGLLGLKEGISGASGLNNIGLLVKVCGRITRTDTQNGYFYVNDGSDLMDGTQTNGTDNVGVRVSLGASSYTPGQYVSVTGISSCTVNGTDLIRLIRVQSSGDVRVVAE